MTEFQWTPEAYRRKAVVDLTEAMKCIESSLENLDPPSQRFALAEATRYVGKALTALEEARILTRNGSDQL